MLKIYHLPFSRSVRLIWLSEALDLSYETIKIDFSPEYRSSWERRSLNPMSKVPVLEGGNITIFPSRAIMRYILEMDGHSRLQPRGAQNYMPSFYNGFDWQRQPIPVL